MKKIKFMIFLWTIFGIVSNANSAPDTTTYPDVVSIPAPVITLRSLATGEPIGNNHYGNRDPRHFHWRLLDVKNPKYEKTRDGGTLVQFQALDTNKCYGFYNVTDCSDSNKTTFSLIPTTTGAFVIKDVELGSCLVSPTYGDYNLVFCGTETSGQTFDVRFLWVLAPAFGPTEILKVPVR